MGLEITVYYPFHSLSGCTLQVINKAEKKVTVLDSNEQGLKVPVWMTAPEAALYTVEENPQIDVFAILCLAELVKSIS